MSKRSSEKVNARSLGAQFRGLNGDVGGWPLLPKLCILVGLVVVIGVGTYYGFYEGQLAQIELKKKEETDLKEEFRKKKEKAINLEAYKDQLTEIDQTFGTLLKQLPEKSQIDALLIEVNQSGLGRGLQFELFKPSPEVVKGFYAETPVTVKLEGGYHDFGAFLGDVAKLSRIVTVNNIVIAPSAKGSSLTMDAVVKTFRYLDPSESDSAKPSEVKKS